MQLTKSNYFSNEAHKHYMSVSQYKDFCKCPAMTMAKLRGEYADEPSEAMLQGSYVHAHFEGTLNEFRQEHPEIFLKDKVTLNSKFRLCGDMIDTLKNDPFVMRVMNGQKEVILTAELFGVPWKIMLDSYSPEKGAFADLKCIKSLSDKFWDKEKGCYVNFIIHYGYLTQMAVYAEVERIASGRGNEDWLTPHIVAVTKESVPDHEVIYFSKDDIGLELMRVEQNMQWIKQMKKGAMARQRCEKCEYCRKTKKLRKAIYFLDMEI